MKKIIIIGCTGMLGYNLYLVLNNKYSIYIVLLIIPTLVVVNYNINTKSINLCRSHGLFTKISPINIKRIIISLGIIIL